MKNQAQHSPLALTTNGLIVPVGFPVASYESIHSIVSTAQASHLLYEHYAGAWNALAYRFRASMDHGDAFVLLFNSNGPTPPPEERYMQEKALFDFFSAGFSVFESTFYGLYVIGAFLSPTLFSLSSQKEQQQITPNRTRDTFTRAFPSDPILNTFSALFMDPEYQKWREIRNVLTHRTAPGRRIYVSIGSDDAPPTEWKLNNSVLDASIVTNGKSELSRLLTCLLEGSAKFVATRL
ncbi:MAG: hypothetical protein Q7S04_02870 [Candidatus Moranbacteria bacterium]|nr:hypothetical protein [Candidatus Moranbacteria bacterium]